MLERKFSIWKLAFRNLRKQRFQTNILFILLFITSVTLFFSDYLVRSMKEGLLETKERLGADLIVVPDRFVSGIEDALFIGKPCTVNFQKEWLSKIDAAEGVDKVSFQLYIASLSMDCCESSMQLIAFDPTSDFVLAPWLSDNGVSKIAKDEVVVGSNIEKKVGDSIKYFGREFRIIDILQETGMGYDNCAFINYEAAYEIANDTRYDNLLPFNKKEQVISMVLVKLSEGQTATEVKDRVLTTYPDSGIAVYTTSSLVNRFASSIENFSIYGLIFKLLFFLLAVLALYGIYSITIHLRKSEFGTYFSFGTRRKTILHMLVAELLTLVLLATFLGIGLVCLFMIPFHEAIRNAFEIPYLRPGLTQTLQIGLQTLAINLLACILACMKSFYQLAHLEGLQLIKTSNE